MITKPGKEILRPGQFSFILARTVCSNKANSPVHTFVSGITLTLYKDVLFQVKQSTLKPP